MEKEEPKAVELEQELDALYRKVASVDKTDKVAPPVNEIKTEAAAEEEPQILERRETAPPKKEEKQSRRFLRIIPYPFLFTIFLILLLCLIAVFFWPTIYYYDAFHSSGMVYPLRISRLTGESSYFDGTTWKKPPITDAVKALVAQNPNIPAAPAASPTVPSAATPAASSATNQIKTLATSSPAAPVAEKTLAKKMYAIQIMAFPENQKKEALAFLEDHKKKGMPSVTMETVPIQGRGVWRRMLVGDFATIKDASNAIAKLNQNNAYPGCFVQKKFGK